MQISTHTHWVTHMRVQPLDSAWHCCWVAHKGEVNGLQNWLWYNQLCQLEMQWCWFHCRCCFPPFDSSVFSFTPPFSLPVAVSLSSSLSLCSKPSTVTIYPSQLCLKARGRERQSLCVLVIVFFREEQRATERQREREGKSSCTGRRTAASAASDATLRQTDEQDATPVA